MATNAGRTGLNGVEEVFPLRWVADISVDE